MLSVSQRKQPLSCGRNPDTGQFLSLFTHPRLTAVITNTCLLFSAMHTISLPPKRPLYTFLSCLLAPALLYKVIWKIIPKWLRILRGSCLKHHSVFLKIFMPLQTRKKVSHYTSNLTAFFSIKTINSVKNIYLFKYMGSLTTKTLLTVAKMTVTRDTCSASPLWLSCYFRKPKRYLLKNQITLS